MFVLCPHCQFLVALDPASGQPPLRCPRCEEALQPTPAPAGAPAARTEPEPGELAAAEAAIAGDDGAATTRNHETASTAATAATAMATGPGPDATAAADAQTVAPAAANAAADAAPGRAPGNLPDTADPEPAALAADIEDHATQPATAPAAVAPACLPEPAPERAPAASAPENDDATPAPAPTGTPQAASGPGQVASTAPTPPPGPARRGKAAPSFVRVPVARHATGTARHKWRQPAAITALALLLALQLLLADRAQLAASARWRPLLSALCGALHCNLPAWREPAAFTLLHRDVRPHPTLPGVLHVSATFRNDARWAQPWPALLLTLSDVDGRSVGARAFVPRDYLGNAPTRDRLASGQSATVAMDIVEPAPRIVAFTFDFH